jgi:hypothetical protein
MIVPVSENVKCVVQKLSFEVNVRESNVYQE